MILTMFKSKIHRATVTEANLNYVGSVTVDIELLKAGNILVGEKVQIVNLNNGERFETYTIPGEAGSGTLCLNGAAARLVQPGDKVILITYAQMTEEEAKNFKPVIIMVDDNNQVLNVKHEEIHGTFE